MTGMADAMINANKEVLVLADGKKTSDDKNKKYKIKRFSGWKPYRRRRKAIYLKKIIANNNIEAIYADSWKSVEHLKQVNAKKELLDAMLQIAETGIGPKDQIPSIGCSIKWKE